MAEEYRQDGWGWQLRLLQARLGEWWERQLSALSDRFPEAGDWSWLNSPWLAIAIKVAFGLLLLLLGGWMVWQVRRALQPYLFKLTARDRTGFSSKATAAITIEDWLKRSQQAQSSGDYHLACYCLYQAMLQRLDRQDLIKSDPARTDGEYRQLVRDLPQGQYYQTLIATHERLAFSQSEITDEIFARCQHAYRQLEG